MISIPELTDCTERRRLGVDKSGEEERGVGGEEESRGEERRGGEGRGGEGRGGEGRGGEGRGGEGRGGEGRGGECELLT